MMCCLIFRMVRHYRRKGLWKEPTTSQMNEALEAIQNGLSIRKAADQFNLNRECLRRHSIKKKANPNYQPKPFHDACGSRRIFDDKEEKELVDYIITCSQIGFPLDGQTIRKLAYQFACRNNNTVPHAWHETQLAGKDWLMSFLKRNSSLSYRIPEAVSLARARSFTAENVRSFFTKLQELYERLGLTPDRILNLDETGLTTSQKPQKVVAKTGSRQISQLVSHERGQHVTLLGIVNAIGNAVPPCLIFPRKKFLPTMVTGAPPGTKGMCHSSGYMTTELFLECLQHIVKYANCSPTRKVVLLMDNHESHLSLDAVDFCKEQGIVVLTFPPHCTHRLQPLDCSVFGPFKTAYNKACNAWMCNHPNQPITIHYVAEVVGHAYPKAFTMANITAGFKSTGISPLDPDVFDDSDFLASTSCGPATDTGHERTDVDDDPVAPPTQPTTNERHRSPSPIHPQPGDAPLTTSPPPPPTASEQPQGSNEENQRISPEMIRPYPIPPRCESRKRGRPPGRCAIMTDTPEKELLAAAKQKKTQKKGTQKNEKKAPPARRRLLDSCATKPASVVKAGWHQGQTIFPSCSRGRQCVAMDVAAACHATIKPVEAWVTSDLNDIMLNGDALYREIARNQPCNITGFLMVSDVPDCITAFNEKFSVATMPATYGIWMPDNKENSRSSLKSSLTRVQSPAAIIIMKETAIVLLKTHNALYIFDSHSRCDQGLPTSRGRAVLLSFASSDDLMDYFQNVIEQFDAAPFPYEITPILTAKVM